MTSLEQKCYYSILSGILILLKMQDKNLNNGFCNSLRNLKENLPTDFNIFHAQTLGNLLWHEEIGVCGYVSVCVVSVQPGHVSTHWPHLGSEPEDNATWRNYNWQRAREGTTDTLDWILDECKLQRQMSIKLVSLDMYLSADIPSS